MWRPKMFHVEHLYVQNCRYNTATNIVAYSTLIGFLGHVVGERNADVHSLIANPDAFLGPGILVRLAMRACSAGAWNMACASCNR